MEPQRPTGPLNDTEIERMEGAEGTPSPASRTTPNPDRDLEQSPYAGPASLNGRAPGDEDEDEGDEEDDLILGDEEEAMGDEEEFEVELDEGEEGDYDEDDLVIDDEDEEDDEA